MESLAPVLTAAALKPLARYHRHQVVGLEHLPSEGGALLVLHHSAATYDALLLAHGIFEALGRTPVGLGHNRLFSFPVLRRITRGLGIKPASPETGEALLADGELVVVAPGGMWEALRPSSEKYQLRWGNRFGFVRLALRAQVPIIVGACPHADDLFDITEHPVTEFAYDRFRMPLLMLRGRRGLPIPRRVSLVHHLAPALVPPAVIEEKFEEQVAELHAAATERMQDLLRKR